MVSEPFPVDFTCSLKEKWKSLEHSHGETAVHSSPDHLVSYSLEKEAKTKNDLWGRIWAQCTAVEETRFTLLGEGEPPAIHYPSLAK